MTPTLLHARLQATAHPKHPAPRRLLPHRPPRRARIKPRRSPPHRARHPARSAQQSPPQPLRTPHPARTTLSPHRPLRRAKATLMLLPPRRAMCAVTRLASRQTKAALMLLPPPLRKRSVLGMRRNQVRAVAPPCPINPNAVQSPAKQKRPRLRRAIAVPRWLAL